jgi:hypothetical protein
MFGQVTTLLSFVYALALTHILTSSTELVWARERLRFSARQALWMVSAVISTTNNWIALAQFGGDQHWNTATIAGFFVSAVVQYYSCSLISMRTPEQGVVDMVGFFEKQRRPFFIAFAALSGIVALQELFRHRWDAATSINLGFIGILAIAGWARPRWLQWAALVLTLGMQGYFLANLSYST